MTINSQIRTAGPFIGNGVITGGPFAFKIFNASQVTVVETSNLGVDRNLVYGTDFSITLNADQNAAPGGTINYLISGIGPSLIPTGYSLNATSNVPNLQPINLTNNGGFFPKVINDGFDRVTILVQQLVRAVNASIQFPLSDGTTLTNILPNKTARALRAIVFDANGNVGVSPDLYANQTAAAAASAAAAEAAAATTVTLFTSFTNTYLGAKTTNPTLNNTGGPLLTGNLYYNSTVGEMRVYNGTAWVTAYVAGPALMAANNLSDVANAATSRANLGLAIGTNVQAYDAATVKSNVVTTYTRAQVFGTATITDQASIVWDLDVAQVGQVTLAGNRNIATTNRRNGGVYVLRVVQDATGGRTLTWGAPFTFPNNTPPVLSTAPGAIDVFIFESNSTDMVLVGSSSIASVNTANTFSAANTFNGGVNEAKATDLASAATVNIGAMSGNYTNITGTTTITAFDTIAAGVEREVTFSGILTLTHNGTSLILPGAANITTAVGDSARFRSLGSGNWKCVNYQRANGTAVVANSSGRLINTDYYTMVSRGCTISVASPGVITVTTDSLPYNGSPIRFTTTGTLPTGLSTGVTYYVVNASGSTFNVSATKGGTAINTTGAGSGTHSVNSAPYIKATNNPSYITAEAIGSGGGGGNVSGSYGGGGGGAGAYVRRTILASALGASETVSIATGGAASTNGTATTLGAFISAAGGDPGGVGQPGTGGLGGAISTNGDISFRGGNGGTGFGTISTVGGVGGSGFFGSAPGPGLNGYPNTGCGGGGSSGSGGGAGGSGILIIREYS